jgi:hypothetical protein
VQGCRVWLDRNRSTEQFRRLAGPAALHRQCAEMTQGADVLGGGAKQRPVHLFRLAMHALPMARNRSLIRLC